MNGFTRRCRSHTCLRTASFSSSSCPHNAASSGSRLRSSGRVMVPRSLHRPGPFSVEENATPQLEVEKRPKQQSAVFASAHMLGDKRTHHLRLQKGVHPRTVVLDDATHVIDALAAEPARVWSGKTLLGTGGDPVDVFRENLTQENLAVTGN